VRLLGQGREAEVFEWGDGTVLRLFRPGAGRLIDHEDAALRAARAGAVRVPALYGRESVDGRPGLVMERIDGEDGITRLARRPWQLRRVAVGLGRIHASVHAVEAPASLAALRTTLERRIESVEQLPSRLRTFALGELRALPDGDRLLHGDFHPGNVLVGDAGPVVIDWTNATRGDPDADVARSALMGKLGEMPPGTPWLLRSLDRFGRGAYNRLYLRAYARERRFDEAMVRRWTIPHAAARLAERIEEEVDALLELLTAAARH